MKEPLRLTIDQLAQIAGNLSKLAAIAGVNHSTVCSWKRRTGQVPVIYAQRIKSQLGVPLHMIRPDIWEPPKPRQRRPRIAEDASIDA